MRPVIGQPPVQFFALGLGERHRFRDGGDAVPNVFNKLDSFRNAEFQNICQRELAHGPNSSVSMVTKQGCPAAFIL